MQLNTSDGENIREPPREQQASSLRLRRSFYVFLDKDQCNTKRSCGCSLLDCARKVPSCFILNVNPGDSRRQTCFLGLWSNGHRRLYVIATAMTRFEQSKHKRSVICSLNVLVRAKLAIFKFFLFFYYATFADRGSDQGIAAASFLPAFGEAPAQ